MRSHHQGERTTRGAARFPEPQHLATRISWSGSIPSPACTTARIRYGMGRRRRVATCLRRKRRRTDTAQPWERSASTSFKPRTSEPPAAHVQLHGFVLRGWRLANLNIAATLLLGSVVHPGGLSTGLAPGY